jgi:serine/threonine protein kinase
MMETGNLCPHCLAPLEGGEAECPHCRHSMENTNPHGTLPYGSLLAGRYTIGSFLSADGEGVLYRAVENTGAVRVTIKEYLPVTLSEDRDEQGALHPKAGSEVLYKTTRMDFVDLYRELMKIMPAAGLEAVLDVVEANNTAYAVMENLGGTPLEEYLAAAGGHVSPTQACSLLQPISEGVAAMHKAGLVHRGVSPENIRVLEGGKTRLTGYATLGLRTAGSALRSQLYEGYSAPEQYSSAEFEGRYTDVYALAAVFYRMVTGQAPLSAGQRLVADSNPPAIALDRTIPQWLSDVLARGMALRPAERVQTVPVLQTSLSSPTAAQATVSEAKRKEKKKPGITGLLAAVLVVLCILVILILWVQLGRSAGSASSESPAATPAPTQAPTEYVPDFVGMTYTQIQASGQYSGHYRFYLTEDYSDTVAVGTVISQTPAANVEITQDADRTITLVVSKGPQSVAVPNVVGFTQDAAVAELEAKGLVASCVMIANDGSYAANCVVKTDPGTDAAAEPGSTVIVYIAAERDVTIPEPTATPAPTPTATPVEEIVD